MTKGYTDCDISLLLETNHMVLRAAEFMGARRYKTWRIYELPLSAEGADADPQAEELGADAEGAPSGDE